MTLKRIGSALRRPAVALAIAAFILTAGAGNTLATTAIGDAEVVVNDVTGVVEGETRALEAAVPIYQNESISTGAGSAAEFQFLDGSILSVGENSQIELTNLIFDPNPAFSSVVLSLTTGVLSFVTGGLEPTAYEIITPTSTIGIRGTVLTVAVLNGITTVSVTAGTVTVTVGATVVTVVAGQAVAVSALGVVGPVVPAASVAPTVSAAATNMTATIGAAPGATAGSAAAASAAAGGLGVGTVGAAVAAAAAVGVAVNAVTEDEEESASTTTTTTTTTTN